MSDNSMWGEEDIKKYEDFRPQLEKIIDEDRLTDYIRERLLVNSPEMETEPSLSTDYPYEATAYGYEEPDIFFRYFLDDKKGRENREKKDYAHPIIKSVGELYFELRKNDELASNKMFVRLLEDLLEVAVSKLVETDVPAIAQCNETILNTLLSGPAEDKYFSEEVETQLIEAFQCTYINAEERGGGKKEAVNWFKNHIEKREYMQHGWFALMLNDYNEAMSLLPKIVRKLPSASDFIILDSIVNPMNNVEKIAEDVFNVLNEEELIFAMDFLNRRHYDDEDATRKKFKSVIDELAKGKDYSKYRKVFNVG